MPAELWVPVLIWVVTMQIRIFTWVEESSNSPAEPWQMPVGPAPLRMSPRSSWNHGYILEKAFVTPRWCLFFLPYIILQQNCLELRAIFLRCKNWIPKCLLENIRRTHLAPVSSCCSIWDCSAFLFPSCCLGARGRGWTWMLSSPHICILVPFTDTPHVPKSSGWKPETGALSLPGPHWLQVFLQHVTEISLDHCFMSSSSHCETGFDFFLSLSSYKRKVTMSNSFPVLKENKQI